MERNLHKIDEVFRSAQNKTNETPPADGWEKLNAALDHQDLERYKAGFFTWKKIAILLFLILGGFILYETIVFKRNDKFNEKLISNNLNAEQSTSGHSLNKIISKNDKSSVNKQPNSTKITKSESSAKNTPAQENRAVKNITKSLSDYKKIPFSIKNNTSASRTSEAHLLNLKDFKNSKTTITNDNTDNKNSVLLTLKLKDSELRKQNEQEEKLLVANTEKVDGLNETAIANADQKINLHSLIPTAEIKLMQAIQKNKKFKSSWSVSPYYSQDIAFYKIDNDLNEPVNLQNESEKVLKRETLEQSFTAGINLKKQISKKISLVTGLSFSETSIGIMPEVIYVTSEKGQLAYKYIISSGYALINPVSRAPLILGDSIKSAEAQHNIQSISIPLAVGYTFYKKKFEITPSAGLTANVITRAKLKTEISDGQNKTIVSTTKLYGTKKFYTNFLANINFQYNLNRKLALNFTPTFKYAINPITKNNVVKTYPYSIGFGVGATFKL